MADDPTIDPTWAAAPPSAFQQLTQTRVPLDEAGEAFTVPDANGRLPIVVLPKQPFRIRNEFVIAGIIAIVVGLIFDIALVARGALVAVGAIALFLGVFQSFIVAVPEGARALLLKAGRYDRTIGAGRHVVPPWIVVSHLITVREIPFEAMASQVPCRDDVRVDLGLLLTFTIVAPDKFVFLISAPDFDQVCLAACLDAARVLVRSKVSEEILDLSGADTDALQSSIEAAIAPYGVQVGRVVITYVQPPPEYMASREARRLAVVRREEQAERHALAERLLADREALKRQRAVAQRERIELHAANEELRLRHLQARITAYPLAARHDVDGERLDVARSLAGNTRAMVQVGGDRDVADALVVHTLADDTPPEPRPPAPPPAAPPKGRTRPSTGGV